MLCIHLHSGTTGTQTNSNQLTWHTVSFFPEVLVCWDMLESTDCVSDASASAAAGLSRPFPNKPWGTP